MKIKLMYQGHCIKWGQKDVRNVYSTIIVYRAFVIQWCQCILLIHIYTLINEKYHLWKDVFLQNVYSPVLISKLLHINVFTAGLFTVNLFSLVAIFNIFYWKNRSSKLDLLNITIDLLWIVEKIKDDLWQNDFM